MAITEIRQRLIGAWHLKSFVMTNIETGNVSHPLGDAPFGLILYTPDGYVAVQMRTAERASFAIDDFHAGTLDEYRAASRSYFAYSGRFSVDEAASRVSHEMAVSFFPNWSGQVQTRIAAFDGDRLHLATDGPQRIHGALQTAELVWERAAPNA